MVVSICGQMGLDAVEIIVGWENAFGINLSDAEVFELRTPRQAIDLIAAKVGASDQVIGVCLGLRAYHRIRQAFVSVAPVPRAHVRLESKLCGLLPRKQLQDTWQTIFTDAGFYESPPFGWGAGIIFWPITIQDIVVWSVARHPRSLVGLDERWTNTQVRAVVRAMITEIVGAEKFSDDDHFIEDIGIS
jgi:hypothetical protein